MISTVRTFIQQHRLIPPHCKVIAAVSGGPDSIALLFLLQSLQQELSFDLTAVSIDHGHRPRTREEALFVQNLAGQICIPHHTLVLTETCPPGHSWEAWARDQRISLLLAYRDRVQADFIALGHHADDQVETFFLRLFRGTSLRGLCGMQAKNSQGFIRPLLHCRRSQILDYLSEKKIPFMEDPTNQDRRYYRNRIRHDLIPSLAKEYSPPISQKIIDLQNLLSRDEEFLTRSARNWLDNHLSREGQSFSIPRAAWKELPGAMRLRVLLGLISEAAIQPSFLSLQRLLHLETQFLGDGRLFRRLEPEACILEGEYATIRLTVQRPCLEDPVTIKVQGETAVPALRVSVISEPDRRLDSEPWTINLPADSGPLTLVTRRGGELAKTDRGSKPLKSLLSELKISRARRENLPLLLAGGLVVWIPGIWCSRTDRQDTILGLRWNPW
ncbi:MAG TPA: tRNA lysidine(34) synthetase TilS [Thermoanaerobaculia bacterium]|nr:tRNA lysidine(34) synthetase TilS [Thermoanaerobaculia bacterium]HUM30804.1 tRNA lysidine(34) synthetase TilS [Thermoanaerobaculia bacterium]HXK69139.1 tRNA lysidine(34) synthetase TilS [Thermoanaerobaculia bacterium]